MDLFDLRCEHLVDPLAVGARRPRLSWKLSRGRQSAYQIAAASDGRPLWDSGRVASDRSILVPYGGPRLRSRQRVEWRVRSWDENGEAGPWSPPARWEMGLLSPKDWRGAWIGSPLVGDRRSGSPCPYLRRAFELPEAPAKARLYITALGLYEASLNGARVADDAFAPGWPDYRTRAIYRAYDVTALLGAGRNALGVILGDGWYCGHVGWAPRQIYGDRPRLLAQLVAELPGGRIVTVATGAAWKTAAGPILESDIIMGERYDARRELEGWDRPDYDDAHWSPAVVFPDPGIALASPQAQPVRPVERLRPVAPPRRIDGQWIYDLGQNMAGRLRLIVEGAAGSTVRLRHAEVLEAGGRLYTANLRAARATDEYTLRGGGPETYEPRFTFHGFRYVGVEGLPDGAPPPEVEGVVLHSDLPRIGSFECSEPLINRLQRNIQWSQRGNFLDIPTDCPQRDERHGWLGDAHLSAEEAVFNFDMSGFYAKFLEDIRLSQKEDGSLADVAPPYLARLYPADPAWGSAYAALAWLHFEHYDDPKVLARHYPNLRKYVEFLGKNAGGNIIKGLGKYGDWCPPGSIVPKKTPVELTSTWCYYHDLLIVSKIARALGRGDDAKEYARLAGSVRDAFNAVFLGEDQYAAIRVSRIDNYPNQTSNILPLYLDMAPPDRKPKVLESLLRSVVRQQDGHVDTGILGTRYLLDVLTGNGHAETAYRVATQRSYPGWAYMIEEGATTLWELLEKLTGQSLNSQNHIMFGSVDAWFYRTLAGLAPLEPGWKRFEVRPRVLGDLVSAEAGLKTVRGPLRAAWKKSEAEFALEVLVPVGAEARVFVPPVFPEGLLLESGRVLWRGLRKPDEVPGVTPAGREEGSWVFDVAGGAYRFELRKAG